MSADRYKQLIAQLECATAPDRMLDSAIGRALETFPTEPFKTEMAWERLRGMYWVLGKKDTPEGPVDEKWSRCPPLYTFSIDAALKLVPEGWFWRVGRTSIYQAWAGVHQTHPDHGEDGRNEFFWHRELWQPPSTPTIALCIASLKARAAQIKRTESASTHDVSGGTK